MATQPDAPRYEPTDAVILAGGQAVPVRRRVGKKILREQPLVRLVGVSTDRGIYVVEPQPDAGPFRITPLADYPHPILSVELGLGSPPH